MLASFNNGFIKCVAFVLSVGIVGAVGIVAKSDTHFDSKQALSLHEHALNIDDEDIELAPGKAGSVLQFVLPSRFIANSGDTIDVSVTMMTSQDVQNIKLTAAPESGMALVSAPLVSRSRLVAGGRIVALFKVAAMEQGRHYLNIVASANLASTKQMSSYSIPIDIGHVQRSAQKSQSRIVEDDQGTKLIIMRAKNPDADQERP